MRTQNLALVYPNNGQPTPTIADVAPSSLAHTRWTVTANTNGRTAGTLALKWNTPSIEMPSVPSAFTGQAYDFVPPVPSTFTVGQFDYINIRNVTDDGWYFAAPPAILTAPMARLNEDGSIDEWGSANFGPDSTGGGRNRVARNQSLRINASNLPVSTMITATFKNELNVAKSISILVTQEAGQILSITRLDPNPSASKTLRWLVTFDRPVAGIVPFNFQFLNFTGVTPNITALDPDAASGFRKWTVTTTLSGDGNGPVTLQWQRIFNNTPESPFVVPALTGETYDVNPLVFSVPPNGSIDIENFYAAQLHFRAAPTPSTAQMSRVGQDTISITPWGSTGFMAGASNWLAPGEYLRINAGTTPVGTAIVTRAYRTTSTADTGFEIRVKVEIPDAQVLSANIIDPSPTVANSVRWDVTFNKSMTGVTAANFGFINSAHIQPTPTITSVVVVPATGNTKWRVTADTTGTGIGLLGLRYLGHLTETPSAPNTFTGQSYDFSSYPLITADPTPSSAIIVTGGQAPTLTIAATIRTGDALQYQWMEGSSQFPTQAQAILGATTSTFTPPTDVPGHRGYFCHVFTMNPNTGQPSGYYANTLTSTMHVYDPPAIVTQPGTIVLPPHGYGTFTVGASGSELVYQWYEGMPGDRTKAINGATAASFTTPALDANKRYWVLVSNPLGSAYEVQSEAALARVITQIDLDPNAFSPVVNTTTREYESARPGFRRQRDAGRNPHLSDAVVRRDEWN